MHDFLNTVLDAAALAGATYADVRVTDTTTQSISVRTGRVEAVESSASFGFGVRVIANGAWGFASSSTVTDAEAHRIARQAVAIAKASALVPAPTAVQLSDAAVHVDSWSGTCVVDPFEISIEGKLDLLMRADGLMRERPEVRVTNSQLSFLKAHTWFASTIGSMIEQTWYESGGGIVAYAVGDDQVLPRSYPNSHGGGHWQAGWEAIEACDFVAHAPRVAEEAAALLTAKECPSATTTVIIDGSQLGLQVHESIGHPTELDRILGDEAAFAGTSFLTLEDLGVLRYGSEHVSVTADATVPGSLGSFGYDDEGVPAQRDFLVTNGVLTSFLTSRESALAIGRTSNGCMRADGWNRIPLIRMTTVSLEPGLWRLPDLIADTDDGIYVETNNSWSIDDKRLNFQFATEIGWEIKNGRLGAMLKSPNYTGITPRFWNSCDAVCGGEDWQVWGLPNCGKGQPVQTAHVAHGAAPARFRNVQVGVGR